MELTQPLVRSGRGFKRSLKDFKPNKNRRDWLKRLRKGWPYGNGEDC